MTTRQRTEDKNPAAAARVADEAELAHAAESEPELVAVETEAPTDAPPPPPTVEQLCKAKKTPAWLFAAAKMHRRWAIGRVVSKADYDAAIREAGSVQLSSPSIRTR